MKLWHSFTKELLLASRGFYFYIEIFMAIILLVVLMFVIPENFESKRDEYIYLDIPEQIEVIYEKDFVESDIDGVIDVVELKDKGDIFNVRLVESEDSRVYLFDNLEDLIRLTKADRPSIGAHIKTDDSGSLVYNYYLQGYESEKLRNLYLIFHNRDLKEMERINDNQQVVSLGVDYEELSDKENVVPSILAFNGSLMGLFIVAAYVFIDKQEGILKAYAVTASSIWHYLFSKIGVILTTSIISTIIITVPIMGLQPNYPILILILLTSGFFVSTLGLLLASFYKDLTSSFGALYFIVILMMLPNIAYYIPSWEPFWIKIIPTHPLIQSFRESIIIGGDVNYMLMTCLGFLVGGIVLFVFANIRYKKNLTA